MPLGNGVRAALDSLKDLDEEKISPIQVSELEVKGVAVNQGAAPFQRPGAGAPAASGWQCLAAALRDCFGVGVDKATLPVSEGGVAGDGAIQALRRCLRLGAGLGGQ